ncbi:hypothetical protein NDU88_006925 [Pleurodeles waltl]|uniref:Uncharacterized protein n=1 Tax=Pleurodeles waltl TaxID=8319 RepID=A0AAV7TYZ8_PLEWA|nr:hypothetical protein NDU88_006925 [Pleurodeles waltl]
MSRARGRKDVRSVAKNTRNRPGKHTGKVEHICGTKRKRWDYIVTANATIGAHAQHQTARILGVWCLGYREGRFHSATNELRRDNLRSLQTEAAPP